MALFIQQNDNRTKLQEKIAAELREKAARKAQADASMPDGVDDSPYLKGTKETTGLAWAWVAIVVIALGIVVFLFLKDR